jgi:para-aminobenzoate synthetase/4-amino-4-deoxychorismate lyase
VNFTFRLRREFTEDPYRLFHSLASREPTPFAAYLDQGSHAICSFSPELFFRLEGDRLVSRPMKGTSRRGVSSEEDLLLADRLRRSPKNRAENIMIVDMVRNDLGRVAAPGSVAVTRTYDIEQYPTLWQMTSTVEARTDAPLSDIVAALFPPASITGAPKVSAMRIIRELEDSPRGVYTGAIGWIAPGRTAQFSVAIRTLTVDRKKGKAEFGVGGGIVWDSDPREEYQECITKAAVLQRRPLEFSLLETLLWSPGKNFELLEDHLVRLRSSARYFGFTFDDGLIRERLADVSGDFERAGEAPGRGRAGEFEATGESGVAGESGANATYARKVRLLLDRDGRISIESDALRPLRPTGHPLVRLACDPIDRADPFLYHKTTRRDAYDRARERAGPCDDVILWNERGEVTESCIANVVVSIEGSLYTPPVACGLLPGVARARALRSGLVRERIITLDELRRADSVCCINAVRGMYEVSILDSAG